MKKAVAVVLCIVMMMSFGISTMAVGEKYGFLYNRLENSEVLEIVGIAKDGELADAQRISIPYSIRGMSVIRIGQSAFINDKLIQNIQLTENIVQIADNAMYGMKALKSIILPKNLTTLGRNAFSYCTDLESVIFQTNNLSEIKEFTFYGCTKLNDVVLSDSVAEIGEYAFAQCMSLDNIYIPPTVSIIADTAFYSANNSFTIYGYKNSQAYYYAQKNNIPFVDMKDKALADLNERITQAENEMAVSFKYTESSVNDLEEALYQAQTVYNNSSTTEEQAKNMTANLERKIDALVDVIKYDINSDGEITLSDIILVQKRFISDYHFNQREIYLADFNSDNKITLSDIVLFQRYLLTR